MVARKVKSVTIENVKRDTLSVAEVAENLGVCTVTVQKWIKAKRLEAYKLGHGFRITHQALSDFIAKQKVHAS